MLRTWRDALKPGGALVMELSDIERSQARLGPLGTVVDREDDGVHEHLWVDPEAHVLHVRYTLGEHTLDVDTRLYEAGELAAWSSRPASTTCGATAASTPTRSNRRAGSCWWRGHERRPQSRRRRRRLLDGRETRAALPRGRLDVVHVQSSAQPPDFYLRALRREDFVANIVHEGDVEATAEQVARFRPAFVVVGSEPGVLVSDALSERLGLPSNGTRLSAARRDKHLMAQALRDAGVRAIEEVKTGDAEQAVAWAAQRGDWPVVVKPVDSAGTGGVVLCETPDAIRAAFAETIGRPNALHGANE